MASYVFNPRKWRDPISSPVEEGEPVESAEILQSRSLRRYERWPSLKQNDLVEPVISVPVPFSVPLA